MSVEHVGSTAVPGLAAKPIIDMDVVVAAPDNLSEAIERLATLGYVHRGNLGIDDREAFDSPQGLPAHHLYLCLGESAALANHLDSVNPYCAPSGTQTSLRQIGEVAPNISTDPQSVGT